MAELSLCFLSAGPGQIIEKTMNALIFPSINSVDDSGFNSKETTFRKHSSSQKSLIPASQKNRNNYYSERPILCRSHLQTQHQSEQCRRPRKIECNCAFLNIMGTNQSSSALCQHVRHLFMYQSMTAGFFQAPPTSERSSRTLKIGSRPSRVGASVTK